MASPGRFTLGSHILAELGGSFAAAGAPDPKVSSTWSTSQKQTYAESLLAWFTTILYYSRDSTLDLVFSHETALQQLVTLPPTTSAVPNSQADQAADPQQLNSPISLILELTDKLANAPAGKTQVNIGWSHLRTEGVSLNSFLIETFDHFWQQQHKDFSSKPGSPSDMVLSLRCMFLTAKLITLMVDHQGTTLGTKSEVSVPYVWQRHILKMALAQSQRQIDDQRSGVHVQQSSDDAEATQCHQLVAAIVRLMLTSISGSLKHNVEAIHDYCLVLAPLLASHWEPSAAARSQLLSSGKHDSYCCCGKHYPPHACAMRCSCDMLLNTHVWPGSARRHLCCVGGLLLLLAALDKSRSAAAGACRILFLVVDSGTRPDSNSANSTVCSSLFQMGAVERLSQLLQSAPKTRADIYELEAQGMNLYHEVQSFVEAAGICGTESYGKASSAVA